MQRELESLQRARVSTNSITAHSTSSHLPSSVLRFQRAFCVRHRQIFGWTRFRIFLLTPYIHLYPLPLEHFIHLHASLLNAPRWRLGNGVFTHAFVLFVSSKLRVHFRYPYASLSSLPLPQSEFDHFLPSAQPQRTGGKSPLPLGSAERVPEANISSLASTFIHLHSYTPLLHTALTHHSDSRSHLQRSSPSFFHSLGSSLALLLFTCTLLFITPNPLSHSRFTFITTLQYSVTSWRHLYSFFC